MSFAAAEIVTEDQHEARIENNPEGSFQNGENQIDQILGETNRQAPEQTEQDPGEKPVTQNNQTFAEYLNSQKLAREGYQFQAMEEAGGESTFRLNENDELVSILEGKETILHGGIWDEIKTDLISNKVSQQVKPIEAIMEGETPPQEAGKQYGSLWVLKEDRTIVAYMAEEVMVTQPEEAQLPVDDDDTDILTPEQKLSPFSVQQTEPEATTPADLEIIEEPLPVIQYETSIDDYLDDGYEDFTVPVKSEHVPVLAQAAEPLASAEEEQKSDINIAEVQFFKNPEPATTVIAQTSAKPAENFKVSTNEQKSETDNSIETEYRTTAESSQPLYFENYQASGISISLKNAESPASEGLIELGTIDRAPSENLEVESSEEEPNVAISADNFIRIERFVVTENSIMRVAKQPEVITLSDLGSEANNKAEKSTRVTANENEAVEDAAAGSSQVQLEIQTGTQVPEAEKNAFEMTGIQIEKVAETQTPVTEALRMPAETQTIEPINVEDELADIIETRSVDGASSLEKSDNTKVIETVPVIKLDTEKPAIRIETKQEEKRAKNSEQILAKPQQETIKRITKKEISFEKPEVVQEPIKIVERKTIEEPEPLKVVEAKSITKPEAEKTVLKKEPVKRPEVKAKPAIEIKVQKVEAPRPKLEQKVIQPEPITLIAPLYEGLKMSPTRSEAKLNINTIDASRFRANSPVRPSVTSQAGKQETVRQTIRQDSVGRILDDLEKDNYIPVAQRTGIGIASMAK